MDFITKLTKAIERNNSLLCVGLDPTEEMLPKEGDLYSRLTGWAEELVAQTRGLVCCYKPNSGFFEQFGPKGVKALADILEAMPEDIPVLLDAKRGDIGSTAEAYAKAAWQGFFADAVTLSPYLGKDSILPFLENAEKAVFLLCHTSNPSAKEIQLYGTPPLYEFIAQISRQWGEDKRIGLVIGATQPEALKRVREICPQAWFLAPGIGAQGGNLKLALSNGLRGDGLGMIIPVSRGIIKAEDPRAAASALRDEINAVREEKRAQFSPGAGNTADETRQQQLIQRLFDCGCVKFGSFTLASGKQSPVYLDLRRLVSFPDVLDLAAEAYMDALLRIDFDLIGGVPYAALPIASIAALKLRRPMIYTRKEVKAHGTGQMVEGVYSAGQKVVLVEDVVTSGGAIQLSVNSLAEVGLNVGEAVVLVDREQGGVENLAQLGIRVHPILKFHQILDELRQTNRLDEATYQTTLAYLAEG